MKTLLLCILSLCLITPTLTYAKSGKGNKPCSGKKGGVKHCTVDHKFMCKDGTVSASKKRCS